MTGIHRAPVLSFSFLFVFALFSTLPAPTPAPAQQGFERTEERTRCDHYSRWRQPFFGDLHVHTSFSMDAVFGGNLVNGPRAAYRFAQGDPVGLPPFDADGNAAATARLRRPLDFIAVTDHSEFLGETRICFTEEHPGFESPECRAMREGSQFGAFAFWLSKFNLPEPERFPFCDGDACLDQAATVWDEMRAAADETYDRSSECRFSSFVGYEWTATPNGANLHRNVIFRNTSLPRLPVSYFDAPVVEDLWDALETSCLRGTAGCDVLTIPHNTNLSLGEMYAPQRSDGMPFSAADAARRAFFEPLSEIHQHKGNSECRAGLDTDDPLCNFELMSLPTLPSPIPGPPPPPFSPLSFLRNALKQGLVEEEILGVNPFQFGFVGATDTHTASAGLTREDGYSGHLGLPDAALPGRLGFFFDTNPGGLTVTWAEENSRDAIFSALRRREVYATSGTRPIVRFFAGSHFPPSMCRNPAFAKLGYQKGVPMGGELAGLKRGRAPQLAVAAQRDPGTPQQAGNPLERIQIIKGWVDASGVAREAVYDVAGGPGRTTDSLCALWTDPDFDPELPAFYYARVLEAPALRWSARQCRELELECDDPESLPFGLGVCCAPGVTDKEVQERAWTSPIWYRPDHG